VGAALVGRKLERHELGFGAQGDHHHLCAIAAARTITPFNALAQCPCGFEALLVVEKQHQRVRWVVVERLEQLLDLHSLHQIAGLLRHTHQLVERGRGVGAANHRHKGVGGAVLTNVGRLQRRRGRHGSTVEHRRRSWNK
jgi:hypothetical protein